MPKRSEVTCFFYRFQETEAGRPAGDIDFDGLKTSDPSVPVNTMVNISNLRYRKNFMCETATPLKHLNKM